MYLKPSPSGPCHWVGNGAGTHEFSRIEFIGGHFNMGHGLDKLGTSAIVSVDVVPGQYIRLMGHEGHEVLVPWSVVQTVNSL